MVESELVVQLTRIADALEALRIDGQLVEKAKRKVQRGKWSPEEDLLILKNWNTCTPEHIADLLFKAGYSRHPETIKTRYFKYLRRAYKNPDERKYLRFSDEEVKAIVELRESGKSYADIAKIMQERGFPMRWTSSYISIYNNHGLKQEA